MKNYIAEELLSLDSEEPIWSRFFTVAPLVLIGTRDANREYNLAPKHMAMPNFRILHLSFPAGFQTLN
jgi:hypothetical protein